MTEPRFVLPGDTVMVTRRTLRRHHLFRPDPAIRQLYLYVLGVCANEFGILVHAVTLMSTHEHLVITDPKRCYPDFLRDLHRLVVTMTIWDAFGQPSTNSPTMRIDAPPGAN